MTASNAHPAAKPIAYVALRGRNWPIVCHEGKYRLPLEAVVTFLGVRPAIVDDLIANVIWLDVATLAIENMVLFLNAFSTGEVTMAATVPLDRVGSLATLLRLYGAERRDAFELAAIANRLLFEASALPAEPSRPTPPKPASEPDTLRVVVTVEGGSPELNRALGNLLLRGLDGIPGSRVETPAPTKH